EMLIEAGFDVIGVDPSYTGDNPRVVRDFFGPELGVKADCIFLRHVFEHIPNPVSFLRMIANANDGGLIYVEVPCLDWIAQKRAWFDIFYEHVNYFRLSDLEAMFGQVLAAERIFGGQYLGIFADLATLKSPSIEVTGPFRLPDGFLSGLKE